MKRPNIVKSLRRFRKWHRLTGLTLAILLVISAGTGILLSLKKEIALIQPPTQKGSELPLTAWKSLHEIESIASSSFYQKYPSQQNNPVDRMDVRPSKGIVKVLFKQGYWEVQIDPVSGEVKSIAKRHSDWIEALHDGSIVSDGFKLVSMTVLGFGLFLLICSGLWLYYGPKKVREDRKNGYSEEKKNLSAEHYR